MNYHLEVRGIAQKWVDDHAGEQVCTRAEVMAGVFASMLVELVDELTEPRSWWSDVLAKNLEAAAALCFSHQLGVNVGAGIALDPYQRDGEWGWEPGCGKSVEEDP